MQDLSSASAMKNKQLMDYGKKFIIIGNCGAVTYKEVLPYFCENTIWIGNGHVNEFTKPNGSIQKFGNICWFTNVEHKKHNTPLDLYKRYSNEYPHYENLNAIDVPKVCDIPMDYDGLMGVPSNFLESFCPSQFEIVGYPYGDRGKELGVKKNARGRTDIEYFINGKRVEPYKRILIRKRNA